MDETSTRPLFRPPAPDPRRTPGDLFDFLKAARTNLLTTWMDQHFEEPVIAGEGVLGRLTVVSDPAAIRHILVDNAANYRKDDLQLRVLELGIQHRFLVGYPTSAKKDDLARDFAQTCSEVAADYAAKISVLTKA